MDLKNRYGMPELLGEPVKVRLAQGACVSTNVLGENEVYFVLNGPPATFYCVDAEDGSIKFRQDFPDSDVVWAIIAGDDKNIYFSGTFDRIFYRYIPAERRVEELGMNPSDKWVWDLRASSDGMVYGCTYPGCKVFEYDTRSGSFRDFGTISEGEQYARGIAVTDRYIYVGVGAHKHLVAVDRVTGEKEEIMLPVTAEDGFIYSLWAFNERLFTQNGHEWLVLDEKTWEIKGNIPATGTISPPSPSNPAKVYFVCGDMLWHYDCESDISAAEAAVHDMSGTKRMGWAVLNKGEGKGRTVLIAATNSAGIVLYDPADGWSSRVATQVEPKPVAIQSLEDGPHNMLYLGGYQCGMSIYDTAAGKVTESIGIPFPQPEGIGFLDGKIYLGGYPGARIFCYDPEIGFNFNNTENSNPKQVFVVKHGQDRPFAMASDEERLYIGTTPYYGKLGGALTIYEKENDRWTVYDNVVKNQSIIGLVCKKGLLCGSTTTWGGLGVNPSEREARIFTWDIVTGTKLKEFTPEIPGLNNPIEKIGGLSFGPDGLLWGATPGAVFAVDAESGSLVKSRIIYPNLTGYSKWRPVYFRWDCDGLLYTTLGSNITLIDPSTLQYEVLIEGNVGLMSLSEDGCIYYAQGTKLFKLKRRG